MLRLSKVLTLQLECFDLFVREFPVFETIFCLYCITGKCQKRTELHCSIHFPVCFYSLIIILIAALMWGGYYPYLKFKSLSFWAKTVTSREIKIKAMMYCILWKMSKNVKLLTKFFTLPKIKKKTFVFNAEFCSVFCFSY